MTEREFLDTANRCYEEARSIVYHLGEMQPNYWEKMTEHQAEYIRDCAHIAHKMAVKLAKQFED